MLLKNYPFLIISIIYLIKYVIFFVNSIYLFETLPFLQEFKAMFGSVICGGMEWMYLIKFHCLDL
jgi:hypothetical protein